MDHEAQSLARVPDVTSCGSPWAHRALINSIRQQRMLKMMAIADDRHFSYSLKITVTLGQGNIPLDSMSLFGLAIPRQLAAE
jgi:hypothetical protein